MTLENLRNFLALTLKSKSLSAVATEREIAVNREILEHVMPGFLVTPLDGKEITAYELDGTVVFMSDCGLAKPHQIVFFDLMSGASFVEAIED